MTVGPWKPIRLETYSTRISEVDVRSTVSENLDAFVSVAFKVTAAEPVVASIELLNANGNLVVGSTDVKVTKEGKVEFKLSNGAAELWYPVGYGKQPLYTVKITIADTVCYFWATNAQYSN